MSESLSWMQTGDTLALSGELDQDVLLPLWEIREEAVKGITSIDLSRVSRVDTGGLALLLHLIDLAKKQGNNVTLQGVNDKVWRNCIICLLMFCLVKFFQAGYGVNRLSGKPACKSSLV
jgi:phospholipid transport system transporter-binding protein